MRSRRQAERAAGRPFDPAVGGQHRGNLPIGNRFHPAERPAGHGAQHLDVIAVYIQHVADEAFGHIGVAGAHQESDTGFSKECRASAIPSSAT